MKSGTIVYIAGSEGMQNNLDLEKAVAELNLHDDRVEVVLSDEYPDYFMEAWWRLLTKGMGVITCKMAEVVNASEVKLTGRELRLFG